MTWGDYVSWKARVDAGEIESPELARKRRRDRQTTLRLALVSLEEAQTQLEFLLAQLVPGDPED